jgi:flagellar hook-associated protein 3 FlgL
MRVSDNTSTGAVSESLRRTRGKMEKLQIQNSTQKRILTPSDDPVANAKIMDIRTQKAQNEQFETNAAIAKNRLASADAALGELYEVFVRAKEIAINQSSEPSASSDSRLGVAQEVSALYKQLVAIANRRLGEQYLFGGYKTLKAPYEPDGTYHGDTGEIPVEVQKDVFVAMNLAGPSVFEFKQYVPSDQARNPAAVDKAVITLPGDKQSLPPIDQQTPRPLESVNAFRELDSLRVGLLTNDTVTIRDTMDRLDTIIKGVITTRAKISSRVSGIDAAIGATQRTDLQNAELATQLEDADYADLWSNMAKEETVLRSSLHAAQKLIQPTLLEFLR